jgi:hypothetical protein
MTLFIEQQREFGSTGPWLSSRQVAGMTLWRGWAWACVSFLMSIGVGSPSRLGFDPGHKPAQFQLDDLLLSRLGTIRSCLGNRGSGQPGSGCLPDLEGVQNLPTDADTGRMTMKDQGHILFIAFSIVLSRVGLPTDVRATGAHVEFSADHGSHPEYKTEWWYFTGNLSDDAGSVWYQLTFFHGGIRHKPPTPSGPWDIRDIYLGHFAITDIARKNFNTANVFRSVPGGRGRDRLDVWLLGGRPDDDVRHHPQGPA